MFVESNNDHHSGPVDHGAGLGRGMRSCSALAFNRISLLGFYLHVYNLLVQLGAFISIFSYQTLRQLLESMRGAVGLQKSTTCVARSVERLRSSAIEPHPYGWWSPSVDASVSSSPKLLTPNAQPATNIQNIRSQQYVIVVSLRHGKCDPSLYTVKLNSVLHLVCER